ncbi:hypothetical protein F0562_012699 [Nyssa sinensis]|uniref:Uncharacterized protein n=1 Tax=Nyssa sinensis TaxID=561372 RepID=A0A5J4ZY70_9ASTE|nr:hypothetical protein F0562_012699 [Nyssa sinensis]
MATLRKKWEASARVLGENDPLRPSSQGYALRMAWDLSWDKIPGELAQALHIMATLGKIRLELSIVETADFKAKARHRSEIEASKVAVVNEQKDKILKLGRKLASDGYNHCLKKMAKAYLEIDTEVLNYIEVSDVESEDVEDNEIFEDTTTPTDP